MATKKTEITVLCYELPVLDPHNPGGMKGTLMKPSPLESLTGRFGRKADKSRARTMLTEAGHSVHVLSWGKHPDTGVDCLIVYLWSEEAAPSAPPSKPATPPERTRRTATSRRNSPSPTSRKKP